MSTGICSGHQSRFCRPRRERTVVGRSIGQPISPVFASMISLSLSVAEATLGPATSGRKRGKFVSDTDKIDQTAAARSHEAKRIGSVHVFQADAQIIVARNQRQRG